MDNILTWESAGTDEPGDQNADSRRGRHAYWSLGPTHNAKWGVELIVRDDALEEIRGAGVHLGHFDSEATAKVAAERRERTYVGPALALGELMSNISEDVYAAGWIQGNEWILWRALLDWRKDGRAYWAPGSEFPHEITEYMPEVDRLQREAGGWVWWLHGRAFVPEARWLRLVERRGDAYWLSNDDLDRAVPEA